MSTGKLLSVSFANLQAASDTTNAKLVTADLKTMSMAQLDLYFTLGIIGTVMYNTRQYQSMSIQTLSKWVDGKESTWGGSVNTDYVILNILGKDGTMNMYCKVKGGVRNEYNRKDVIGYTRPRRSLSDTWSVLGWLGGKSACVAVNDVQRKCLGLERCLGSDRAVSSEQRVSELSTWSNAKPFGRDTVFERDSVWHSSVVRNEYAKHHSCAHKNGIFIQRLVSSDHDTLTRKEVAA